MDTTSLRETTPQPGKPATARRALNPTQLFAERDRLAWFWFLVAGAITLIAAWDRHQVVAHFKTRERVVIIDPAQTAYVSPLLHFQEAKDLHVQQAELAAIAFLQRNPKDFDQPELLKQLFLQPALAKAQDSYAKEQQEFRAKALHQKPEIARVEILATRENSVLAHVTGQLIRTGVFQDKAFTEGLTFSLKLNLVRNPNMAINGRFPTAVAECKYEVSR